MVDERVNVLEKEVEYLKKELNYIRLGAVKELITSNESIWKFHRLQNADDFLLDVKDDKEFWLPISASREIDKILEWTSREQIYGDAAEAYRKATGFLFD